MKKRLAWTVLTAVFMLGCDGGSGGKEDEDAADIPGDEDAAEETAPDADAVEEYVDAVEEDADVVEEVAEEDDDAMDASPEDAFHDMDAVEEDALEDEGGGDVAPDPEEDGLDVVKDNEEEFDPERACIDSGGTVDTMMCCLSTDDFPNLCMTGPCGCAPDYSHEVDVCVCGSGECFDGTSCVAMTPP